VQEGQGAGREVRHHILRSGQWPPRPPHPVAFTTLLPTYLDAEPTREAPAVDMDTRFISVTDDGRFIADTL
jgi:hypothetical protein